MYIAKTWKNDGESGAIPLNKTNLQTLDNAIEGAVSRKLDIRYCYANNIIKLNDCNTVTDWVNGAWDNSNGTASGVTNAVRASLSTIGYGIKYQYTSFASKTIAEMDIDQENLCLVFYMYIEPTSYSSYLTSSTNLRITIAQNASPTLTRYAYVDIPKSQLLSGYDAYYIPFESFTLVGGFDLNTYQTYGMSFSLTGSKNSGTVIIDIYYLSWIRKDVNTGYPNPFQYRGSSGELVPLFHMMTANYWYGGTGLSDDSHFISFQHMADSRTANKLMMKLNVTRQKFQYLRYYASIRNNSVTSMIITYYVDANNFVDFSIGNGVFEMYWKVGGSASLIDRTISFALYDNFEITIFKEGNYYTAICAGDEDKFLMPFVMTSALVALGDTGDWYIGNDNYWGMARDEIKDFEYRTL
jgi:hypothetical protein